jgi:hypothetical protein
LAGLDQFKWRCVSIKRMRLWEELLHASIELEASPAKIACGFRRDETPRLGKWAWTSYSRTVTVLVLILCLVLLIAMVGVVMLARGHRTRGVRKG